LFVCITLGKQAFIDVCYTLPTLHQQGIKSQNILYVALKVWSDLRVVFREEFLASEMTIREKFLIFWKIFTPAHTVSLLNNDALKNKKIMNSFEIIALFF
jgi:hypothetical protein